MRFVVLLTFGLCLFIGFTDFAIAQATEKTIILVRHAEKESVEGESESDPDLSADGKLRAERLAKIVKRYRVGAVYSTDYKRTKNTVELVAQQRGKKVQVYDASKPQELIDEILNSNIKRIVVAGHSNTIPELANILFAKNVFKNLDDSEFGAIWVVRIKNSKPIKIEILAY